jgi:hypothetical protein
MKNIHVFLNSKLVTLDTIIPITFELKKQYAKINIIFVVTEYQTYKQIFKNYFLYNSILKVGNLKVLDSKSKSFSLKKIYRIKLLFYIIIIGLKSIIYNSKIFHFGFFNNYPWKILAIFGTKNIYIFDNMIHTSLEFNISNIKKRREKTKFSINTPVGSNLIYYHEDALIVKDKRLKNIRNTLIPPTHNYDSWSRYINNNYKNYLDKELKKNNLNYNKNILSIMLGTFSPLVYLDNENSVRNCLYETLEVLGELKLKYLIFIKPHVISDPKVYNEIINKFPNLNILITQLHPAVLASVSKVFICNYFSNTMLVGKDFGTTTIEYTQYNKEALKISRSGSMMPQYIDHFINKNPRKLKIILRNCFNKPKKRKNINKLSKKFITEILTP